ARKGEEPDQIYWHDTPELREQLHAYCLRDVEIERALYHRLPPLPAAEQKLWQLDANINERGFHVDVTLAKAARDIVLAEQAAIDNEITRLTGGKITNANQVGRITDFVRRNGHALKSLNKRSVSAVLAHEPDETVRRLLELRREGARASVRKL